LALINPLAVDIHLCAQLVDLARMVRQTNAAFQRANPPLSIQLHFYTQGVVAKWTVKHCLKFWLGAHGWGFLGLLLFCHQESLSLKL
jgi:hypothetical protein